tara:strand:+ start:3265 stop:4305 length:1041 start_codon:yes stop_codon:yes gene_type:complete
MMKKIKILIYTLLKYTGVFWVSRRIQRKKLRILCYHGIAFQDEHAFKPTLFMTEDLFRHRMDLLAKSGYRVISLETAVKELKAGTLADNSVVITFDDGWEGTFSKAVPILQQHDFPVTIYITSYYAEKQVPVLNVLLQYILWKSPVVEFDMESLGIDGLSGRVRPGDAGQRQQAVEQMLTRLETHYQIADRYRLCETICQKLQVDGQVMRQEKMFMLATPDTIGQLGQLEGVDIELHTHRHVFPEHSFEACEIEIEQNRDLLRQWTGHNPTHFCYPSGWYLAKQLPWLQKMGVESATTVQAGLNGPAADVLQLGRFLDGQNVSDIEFEAELSGFADMLRKSSFLRG